MAFVAATKPAEQKASPPAWQIGVIEGLFGAAATWGPSFGYYRGGLPIYATLAGIGKTALIGGAVLFDRRASDEGTGMPIASVLALAGLVTWDIFDFALVKDRVRERHAPSTPLLMTPVVMATPEHAVLGAMGKF